MANWTTPSLTDLYTNFLAFLKDRDVDLAKAFDPAKITTYPTSIPTDTVRWNSAAFRWELYNGTVWAELLPLATGKYSINVDRLDGLDAGNATGNIPISNGTVNANLNADLLNGYQPGTAAGQLLILDVSAAVPVAALPASGVALGTYRSVTVDAKGRVTGATNPTTIAGYGLTDAAPINSPTFTGAPISTTPTAGDNTTKIATTAYIQTALATKANVASPTFTGTVFLTDANVSVKQLGGGSLQVESAQNSIVTGKSAFYAVANAYWDSANWYSRDTLAPSTAIQVDALGNAVKVLTSVATVGVIAWTVNTLWHSGNDGAGSGLDADLLDGQSSLYFAPILSPAFTGTPSLPAGATGVTQASGDNTTKIATTAYVLANAAFLTGTRMSFNQTSAPTGWTKDVTAALDDSIMRIVVGTVGSGGSTAFTTFNGQTSVGATTLTIAQIPSHTHTRPTDGPQYGGAATGVVGYSPGTAGNTTGATGGGGSHTHGMTTAIKYNDFIIASKN